MKNVHEIGEVFTITYRDGVVKKVVARECESYHDEKLNEDFRKTCRGCMFCKIRVIYCSGHPIFDEECLEGGCKGGKCSPEYREDGKYIHYKEIVRNK